MKLKRAWLYSAILVVFALFSPLNTVNAGKLREFIKDAMKKRIDEKALQHPVSSTRHNFEFEGRTRTYYLYLPTTWNKKDPIPVVFLFHGGAGGGRGALYYYELEAKAEEAGFMLVAPDGTGETENILLTWNVSFGFGYAQKNRINDTGFIAALLDKLSQEFPVDTKRIYATGLSNGAMFCHWLAAQPENRFAAIAPVVGTVGGKEQHEKDMHLPPVPQTPVSVCIIQGLVDEHVLIGGGAQKKSITEARELLSASATIDFWVRANGCDKTASTTFDQSLLSTVHHHANGRDGSEVTAYVVHNLGHAWPGSTRTPRKGSDKPPQQFKANDIIWDFFKNHPKP
ncbi:PHB depolymerase family esterase [Erysipelotrichia bacterium]